METLDPGPSRASTSSLNTSTKSSNVTSAQSVLEPAVMVAPPRDDTPPGNRSPTGLPRPSASGRGGCWTCRVRRKKCDEQWEGESCSTCKRLDIECLGWGPRRPEWLRDKHLVARYRAQITEKLTRAGRIRGQPRTVRRPTPTQSNSRANQRAPTTSTTLDQRDQRDPRDPRDPREQPTPYHPSLLGDPLSNGIMFSPIMDPLSSSFPPAIHTSNTTHPYYSYTETPVFHTPSPYLEDPIAQDIVGSQLAPTPVPVESSEPHVTYFSYYLNHARSLQFTLLGTELVDITNSLITRDPNGAVAKAICALSSLHMWTQNPQGLEAPMDHSTAATYFHDEAAFLIERSLHVHGSYTDSDAITALHLMSFSQLSGGQFLWTDAFAVLCARVMQSTLPSAEDPCTIYNRMSSIDQYIVKATLTLDVFASLATCKGPKFLELMRRLLGKDAPHWPPDDGDIMRKICMENFAGLPNTILLGIAETNELSHWKAGEIKKGSLSYRMLVRRGEGIERLLHDQSPSATIPGHGELPVPGQPSPVQVGQETQQLIVNIFRQGALQYLNSVISGCNPDVPEIKESVQAVVRLLYRSQPVIDQSLVFPTFITASLANDPNQRESLRGRLRVQDSMALDRVWRARDAGAVTIDVQDFIRDTRLLLV